MSAPSPLASEINEIYASYAQAIDSGALDSWPSYFADSCRYRIITKENHAAGRPLCLVLCDSQGMLQDRVSACLKLNVYAPRSWRHLLGRARIALEADHVRARANFVVFETVMGQPTQVLCAGEYDDKLVQTPQGWKFAERTCICDTAVIPGSIVFPI